MRLSLAIVLSSVAGYIALSYELLWFRTYFLAKNAQGGAFAVLLSAYLFGLALGAAWARRFCESSTNRQSPVRAIALIAAVSYLLAYLSIPAFAAYCTVTPVIERLPWLALASAALGAVFPLTAHAAVAPDEHAGRRLSYLYLANIVGSTLGTLVTGLWLMDAMSLKNIAVMQTVLGLSTAAALLPLCGLSRRALVGGAGAIVFAGVVVVASADALFDGFYERVQLGAKYRKDTRFAHVLERRGGVITVDENGVVRGHGTYDGEINVFEGVTGSSGLFRPLALSAIHPAPRRVLQIGMATGAWTQILANNPEVDELVVVEIDRAYLELIPKLPEVASILSNPKVRIIIDDARRWLARNPDEKFDAIVSNVSLHWIAGSSALLSIEFNELAKSHLAPGGLYLYNSTLSGRARRTTRTVFPHVALVGNAVAAQEAPVVFHEERWRDVMSRYVVDGRALFDLDTPAGRRALETAWNAMLPWESSSKTLEHTTGLQLITDDNLGYEFDDLL